MSTLVQAHAVFSTATVTPPAAPTVGNLAVLAAAASNAAGLPAPPDGTWTEVASITASTGVTHLIAWAKRLAAGDAGPFTVTGLGAGPRRVVYAEWADPNGWPDGFDLVDRTVHGVREQASPMSLVAGGVGGSWAGLGLVMPLTEWAAPPAITWQGGFSKVHADDRFQGSTVVHAGTEADVIVQASPTWNLTKTCVGLVVAITALEPAPVAVVDPAGVRVVTEGSTVTRDLSGSTYTEGTVVAYATEQVDGAPVDFAGSDTTATPGYTVPAGTFGTTLRFRSRAQGDDGRWSPWVEWADQVGQWKATPAEFSAVTTIPAGTQAVRVIVTVVDAEPGERYAARRPLVVPFTEVL